MNKKIIIAVLALLLVIFLGWYFFYYNQAENMSNQLKKLKQEQPQLASYIDDVLKEEEELNKDKTNVSSYLVLGLAWKSLADRVNDLKIEDYKIYYKNALAVYEKGVEITDRKNTVFIVNAGNMAKYLEDYGLAEDYYREAITVAPGEVSHYVLLAELYEYKMGKTKEEILAVYDEGINRVVLSPDFLEKRKGDYLERIGQ